VLTQRCAGGAATTNLLGATTMFDVARLVSDAMRETEERDAKYFRATHAAVTRRGYQSLSWLP